MPTKVIVAKLPGVCGICNKEYPAGRRIAKDAKTDKWVEANCLWPKHANSVNAPRTEGEGSQPTPNLPAPLTESQIEEDFSRAWWAYNKGII